MGVQKSRKSIRYTKFSLINVTKKIICKNVYNKLSTTQAVSKKNLLNLKNSKANEFLFF